MDILRKCECVSLFKCPFCLRNGFEQQIRSIHGSYQDGICDRCHMIFEEKCANGPIGEGINGGKVETQIKEKK